MKMHGVSILGLFLGAIIFGTACGSRVTVEGTGGAGGSGGSGGSGGCAGSNPLCAWGCGSDAFEQSVCQNGTWVCPPGTINPNDCPSGTCWGAPLPCEVCNSGWTCKPDAACIGTCESFVCASCNGAPAGTTLIGACECSCNSAGYGCALAAGCCNQDIDCGDKTLFPCVNNVCKAPVMGGCWADVECGPGMKCQGAVVCPCGFDCNLPDSPGMCTP